MKQFYSLFDIEEFIAQHDCGLWTRTIYDHKQNKPRQAKMTDFEEGAIHTLETIDVYDEKSYKDFAISNFRFLSLAYSNSTNSRFVQRDLSEEWCATLVETYGTQYTDEMKKTMNEDKKKIDEFLKNPKVSKEQKAKCEKILSFYARLSIVMNNKLQEIENKKNSDMAI